MLHINVENINEYNSLGLLRDLLKRLLRDFDITSILKTLK